jgi:hypothetical protein
MTQHEYVFVAISIILGLAITRLLHTGAMLIRAQRKVTFHWSTAVWSLCIMVYSLQLWWVGWGLRNMEAWHFFNFLILTAASIFVYGAAEMALPVPEGGQKIDLLAHSEGQGRISAVSMLLYFLIGPYVNITMFGHDVIGSIAVPAVGIAIMTMTILLPKWFPAITLAFAAYSVFILYVTI